MSGETKRRFEAEKAAYWAIRQDLLKEHPGKWVAVVDGQVVAIGDRKSEVLTRAFRQTRSPVGYINRVGSEDAVLRKRIRQVVTGQYQGAYDPPMPMVTATVADPLLTSSADVDLVVDTGADLTVLSVDAANRLNLWEFGWDEADVSGIGTLPERRQLYLATVQLAGREIAVTVDCRNDLAEDILGRDVINEFELAVCAKRDVVRFEWVEDEHH